MPYCFTEDASRIFEEIANAPPRAFSSEWWDSMQKRVANEAQAHSVRQEYSQPRQASRRSNAQLC